MYLRNSGAAAARPIARIAAAAAVATAIVFALPVSAPTAAARDGDLASRCISAALAPLPLLEGRVFVAHPAETPTPALLIRWRAEALPPACEGRFRRSIAVQVRLSLSEAPVPIPIGRGRSELQWLSFDRSDRAAPRQRAIAIGHSFAESLGCIESVEGAVRYRVRSSEGRLVGQRLAPYAPRFHACGTTAR